MFFMTLSFTSWPLLKFTSFSFLTTQNLLSYHSTRWPWRMLFVTNSLFLYFILLSLIYSARAQISYSSLRLSQKISSLLMFVYWRFISCVCKHAVNSRLYFIISLNKFWQRLFLWLLEEEKKSLKSLCCQRDQEIPMRCKAHESFINISKEHSSSALLFNSWSWNLNRNSLSNFQFKEQLSGRLIVLSLQQRRLIVLGNAKKTKKLLITLYRAQLIVKCLLFL